MEQLELDLGVDSDTGSSSSSEKFGPNPSRRIDLRPRRESITQKFDIYDKKKKVSLYVTVGLYPDGQPGEIFLALGDTGEVDRSWMDAVARGVSIALQHGVPLHRLVDLYIYTKWRPFGPVKGYSSINMCSGPLDLVFRWLGIEFLGMDDLGIQRKVAE